MRSEVFACPKCKDLNTRLQNAVELGQDRVHIRVRDLDSTHSFKGGVVEANSRSFVSVGDGVISHAYQPLKRLGKRKTLRKLSHGLIDMHSRSRGD